ncbi:hypothetical protein PAAG_11806 [Paracoccidioides lutzii Pb01]|uniref:Uncharacterized protein n=1 Tax=Paracoccidioides lutzii (strain ATCC MYA-826 / Pb01) TaxID=502779 RepID=A0A0A2V1S4_PARBA|nr:hypothetical protein PAAG_11806 [Paracoccidioides lutzii Pb01]KGQ01458.1 hypothetical protein PAAG_11806 [Paracoccidioides lutzii Pb01]
MKDLDLRVSASNLGTDRFRADLKSTLPELFGKSGTMGGLRRACESPEKRGSWDLMDNRSGVNCLPINCGCDAQNILTVSKSTDRFMGLILAFGKTYNMAFES